MPLDAKELAKEKELNRELSDEEMDRLLIPRRSVGTWMTFGLLFVVLLGGAGYLFGARVLKAGRDYAAEVAAVGTTEQRQQAQEVLEHVNSRLTLWKLQHQGRMPGFDGHPEWEQFTRTTDVSGKLNPGRGMPICGPYLSAKPVNPINNLSDVFTWEGKPSIGDMLPGGAKAGFVYSKTDGRFWVTDVAGTRVIDPAAAGAGAKPADKPADKPAAKAAEAPEAKPEAKPVEAPVAKPTQPPAPTPKAAPAPAPSTRTEPVATRNPGATPAKTSPAKGPAQGGTQPKSRK